MLEGRFFRPLLETFFFAVLLSATAAGRTFDSNVIDWSFFCGDDEEDEDSEVDDNVDGATEEDDDERNCINPFGT